jgi:hypothetical protein
MGGQCDVYAVVDIEPIGMMMMLMLENILINK